MVLIAFRATGVSPSLRKFAAVGLGIVLAGVPYVFRIEGSAVVLRFGSLSESSDTPAIRRIAPRNFSVMFIVLRGADGRPRSVLCGVGHSRPLGRTDQAPPLTCRRGTPAAFLRPQFLPHLGRNCWHFTLGRYSNLTLLHHANCKSNFVLAAVQIIVYHHR